MIGLLSPAKELFAGDFLHLKNENPKMKIVKNEHDLEAPLPLEQWLKYRYLTVSAGGHVMGWVKKPTPRPSHQLWNLDYLAVCYSEILSRTAEIEDYEKHIWENPLPFLLQDPVTEKGTGRIGRVKTYIDADTVSVVWVQFGHPAFSNVSKTDDYPGEEIKVSNLKASWDEK